MTAADIFYPSLIICGLLLAMLAISAVSSYFWLRHVDARYRKCPNCERKGVGDVVATNVVNSQTRIDRKGRRAARVTVETHEDQYLCSACDHRWTVRFKSEQRQEMADTGR